MSEKREPGRPSNWWLRRRQIALAEAKGMRWTELAVALDLSYTQMMRLVRRYREEVVDDALLD